MGQKPISSDTIIRKNLSVNQGFELKFVDCPGAGYGWSLSAPYDSTVLSVRQKSSELMKGNHPVGGHYVRTYYYKVLSKKNITLVYYYQRPWLQDNVYKCKILIRVK
jgi:predicted secreted protein